MVPWNKSRGSRGGLSPARPAAERRKFLADFGCNIRDESFDLLLTLQDDTLALFDFIEPLFGCLAKYSELGIPFLPLSFEKTQSLADDFAGVAVAPRGDLARDEMVQMGGQIDVARWLDRLLWLSSNRDWQRLEPQSGGESSPRRRDDRKEKRQAQNTIEQSSIWT
jgi:hypothetical protein